VAATYDLDGLTTVRWAGIQLVAAAGQRLTSRYVFAHDASSTSADWLRAIVEREDGSQVEVFRVAGSAVDLDGVWRTASISMDAFAGTKVHLRLEAVDGGAGNLVEAELDDIRITKAN
jgi:hypothetical protein